MSYATFCPFPGGGQVVSASGTNTATTVIAAPDSGSWQCRIYNATAVVAFIGYGPTVPTTSTGMPVAAGGVEWITVSNSKVVNVILASSTGNVYLTPGSGY